MGKFISSDGYTLKQKQKEDDVSDFYWTDGDLVFGHDDFNWPVDDAGNRLEGILQFHPKPSGWKDNQGFGTGRFWTKGTKFGVKYECKTCGKRNLGLGSYNHWKTCPHHRDNQEK